MTLEERIEELERICGAITEHFNDKSDRDLHNISTGGKSFASALSMPSSRHIDLEVRESGSTYTAPANGWISVRCDSTQAAAFILLTNHDTAISQSCSVGSYGTPYYGACIPCKKGETIELTYGSITKWWWFIFIYAEGEI